MTQNKYIHLINYVMKRKFTLFVALLSTMLVVQSVKALTYTVTVPEGTQACYITGEMNGWSPSKTKLNKVNATTFSIDLPDAKETDKYQYLSGPDWKYIEKKADGTSIQDRTWAAADVVEKWDNLFKYDSREVTVEALVPSKVIELYLVGNFNGWASPAEAFKMKLEEETVDGKIFSIKVFSEDAINMEFKFIAGPAWAYEQLDPKDNFLYGTMENTISVVVNSFKEYFDPSKTGTINIKATVPVGTNKVWIQGDHLGWSMDNAKEGVKNEDGTFSFSVPMVMAISYRLYNKPDWGYYETDEEGNERKNREARFPEDANTEITVLGWKVVESSVSKVSEAQNKIYSFNNVLIVEDVKSKIEIFDVSGRLIQASTVQGMFRSAYLNPGFYVIKIDNASKKISIR